MRLIVLVLLAIAARGATVVQMACGGPGGAGWTADTKQGGGAYWTAANQPAMASQPIPYQTLCYSSGTSAFSRTFTVPAGSYAVTLKWLEPNKTAVGQRTFSASINGAPVAIGLDVFAAAGGAMKPYDRTFQVQAPGGFIQVTLAGTIGNALLSAIQIDTATAPDAGSPISCESDTIKVGTDLVSDESSKEIEILYDIPGNWRYEQITLCATERFLGQTSVTASMGRAGTNNQEMTGAEIPLNDTSNNSTCWTARPIPPQFIGPYSIVVNFKAYTSVNGVLGPGKINNLTGGVLTWEVCGYPGKIGDLTANVSDVSRLKSQLASLKTCTGSGISTQTQLIPAWSAELAYSPGNYSNFGAYTWISLQDKNVANQPSIPSAWWKPVTFDCAGLWNAAITLKDGRTLSLVGSDMQLPVIGNPLTAWLPVQ